MQSESYDLKRNREKRKWNKRVKNRKFRYRDNFLSKQEFKWLEFVKSRLHSIWALHDEAVRIHRKERNHSYCHVFNLAKDLASFDKPDSFESRETLIWNVFRVVSTARVMRDDFEVIEALAYVEGIESENRLANASFKNLLFCAKIECYLALYILLQEESTTDSRIGFSISFLEREIDQAYDQMHKMLNLTFNNTPNPNYANFPRDPYLISRVLILTEEFFYGADFSNYGLSISHRSFNVDDYNSGKSINNKVSHGMNSIYKKRLSENKEPILREFPVKINDEIVINVSTEREMVCQLAAAN